jgi:UPF0755 protein
MPYFIRLLFKLLSRLIGIVLVLASLLAGGVVYFNAPPDKAPAGAPADGDSLRITEDGAVLLEVRNGESAASVGGRLETAGIIRNRHFWNLLYYIDREYIKAGVYRIRLPASQMEIRSILVSGRQLMVRVTVPEGATLKKTARIMEDAGICEAGAFLAAAADREILDSYRVPGATMEGYLYPDTYFFSSGYPASQVVKTMADTFFRRLGELGAAEMSAEDLNKRVIIASIVEREYRVGEEAALMAGVFYNRLKIGMALQSCATVEYIITEIQDRPHPEVLYNRDIEIRDPYNTYLGRGLPPGPISAPGSVALDAALHPASTDYLYFRLTDPAEGRHYFSKTLDDHIKAGILYVKGSSL